MPRGPVGVGTDCSGMEAPIQAIRNLGVPFKHVFSCDIDRNARATIQANFPHGKMYEDVTTRDNTKTPYSDVYVAGFPCQPFSLMGLHQGFDDVRGRGKIFFDIRDYVEQQKPKIFVLENVAGLKSINNGQYFEAVLESLHQLGCYNVHHRILNTKQMGVPQNRRRIYIVGIRQDVDEGTFRFPEPIPCAKLDKFLDKRPKSSDVKKCLPPATQTVARSNVETALRELTRKGSDPWEEPWVVDCDSSASRSGFQHECSPCITCRRADGHWVTSRGRRLRKTEMMRLQGMNPSTFKVAVVESQLGKQLGNTMSVNVLERLFARLLPAAGLAARTLPDRWESGEAVRVLAATRGQGFGTALAPEERKSMMPWALTHTDDKPQAGRKQAAAQKVKNARRLSGGRCTLKRRSSDASSKSGEKKARAC